MTFDFFFSLNQIIVFSLIPPVNRFYLQPKGAPEDKLFVLMAILKYSIYNLYLAELNRFIRNKISKKWIEKYRDHLSLFILNANHFDRHDTLAVEKACW